MVNNLHNPSSVFQVCYVKYQLNIHQVCNNLMLQVRFSHLHTPYLNNKYIQLQTVFQNKHSLYFQFRFLYDQILIFYSSLRRLIMFGTDGFWYLSVLGLFIWNINKHGKWTEMRQVFSTPWDTQFQIFQRKSWLSRYSSISFVPKWRFP